MAVNQSVLEILIRAKDEASATLKNIEGFAKRNESTFKGMAAVGGAAFAGLTGFIALSAKAASDAEVAQTRLDQILRTATGATDDQIASLMAQADALERVGVVSGDAINAAQGTLATFDLQSASIKKLIPSFLNMVVAEKGVNATTDDMIGLANGLGKVLQGQVGALSKQGFVFDEATEAILKNGTETEKVTALAGILDSTYAGLNERMRGTTEGGIVGMTNAFGKLQEEIGKGFLPLINDILSKLTPLIVAATDWIANNQTLTTVVIIATAALAGLVAVAGLLGLALPLVAAGFAVILSPIGLVTAGIIALGGYIVWLISHWDDLRDGTLLAWEAIKIGFGKFFDAITSVFKKFEEFVKGMWDTVTGYFKAAADKIAEFLQPVVDFIDSIKDKLDALKSAASRVTSFFGGDKPGKATGGTVMGGQSYTVGERGPEVFTPGTSGFISPMFAGTGGQSVQVVINGGFFGTDPMDTAEHIGDLIIERFKIGAKL